MPFVTFYSADHSCYRLRRACTRRGPLHVAAQCAACWLCRCGSLYDRPVRSLRVCLQDAIQRTIDPVKLDTLETLPAWGDTQDPAKYSAQHLRGLEAVHRIFSSCVPFLQAHAQRMSCTRGTAYPQAFMHCCVRAPCARDAAQQSHDAIAFRRHILLALVLTSYVKTHTPGVPVRVDQHDVAQLYCSMQRVHCTGTASL